ncbi:peroxisomal assembly protein, partial [Coemansia sp. RSA 2671]
HVPLGETDVRLGVAQAIAADTEADASLVDIDPASDIIIDGSLARHQWAQPESSSEYAFYRVVKVEGFRGGRQSGSHSSSSDSDSEDEDDSESECESDYKFIEGDDSSDPLDQEWMLWYHQVHNKGFVVRPDVTMVVQSGAVHGYVPYRPVCAYEGAGKNRRNVASASIPENMAYSDILKQLLRLASTSLHPLALSHGLTCAALLKGSSGTGKRYLVRAVAEQLGVHMYELNCYDILSESEDKAAQVLHVYFENASRYTPCVLHLRSIEALAQTASTQQNQDDAEDLPIARVLKKCLADINMAHRDTGFPIIVIASSGQPDKVPTSLAAVFHHEIELPVPDERTRLALLTSITERSLLLAPDTDIAYVAQQTASFVARDLVTLTHDAQLNIIQALTRKFHLHPNLDLRSIAEQCPFHYTGADFYALCSDALLKAMLRTVDEVDLLVKEWNDRADGALPQSPEKTGGGEAAQMYLPVPMTPQYYLDHIAPDSVKQVTVTASDFETALDELIPSVSADELVRYQVLRHQFDSVLKGKARSESATAGEGASRQPLLADDRVSPPDTFAEGSSTHQTSAKSKGKGKEPDI